MEVRDKILRRYRKKPLQMDTMDEIFKENKGKMPPRKLRIRLAGDLNMTEGQVYKWFWELRMK